MKRNLILMMTLIVGLMTLPGAVAAEELPSWNNGKAKQAIVQFVTAVTKKSGPKFIRPAERIAVFDNDGTLWIEKPIYVQLVFVLDRVRTMAPDHPEWRDQEPFKFALKDDLDGLMAGGEHALLKLIMASHAGMTTDAFAQTVQSWLATAEHPHFNRHYTDLVYQPMLELLTYLRANGFKTYIVSGGGIEFMRPWTEKVYGIPPEQVIGSSIKTKFELRNGKPVLIRLPEINFIDDKEGKPVGINQHIGRRPVFAFGNSDGDLQMLQWTAAGQGPRFIGIIHHTDAEREWAYDRKSHVGRLEKALDQAMDKDWTLVDMKKDWKVIFPFQLK